MQIEFTGHKMEMTDAIREYTTNKFSKFIKHFDKITSIHVVFNVEKLRQIAEATILVSKDKFHASSEDENLYAAIDLLADKLNKQLMKHKEKIQGR
jgi:putative sigma-54 modulation protein